MGEALPTGVWRADGAEKMEPDAVVERLISDWRRRRQSVVNLSR